MKKRIVRTVSVMLAVLLIFPQIMFSASALTFNGTASASGDGSSTSASTGGYAVPSFLTQNSNRAVGYRFTVVDGAGAAKKSSQDVFRYNSYTTYGPFFAGYYKFNSKLPKTYYKNNYSSGSYTTSSTTTAVCHDSNMGLTLPEDTTGIKAWCTAANIGKVLSTLWSISVSTLESNAWAVLIEPIFPVKIQNTYHSLTVTEMAVYGAAKFGAGSNGGASSNSNSWGFVSEYTNRYLPNSLRLTSALAGLPAAANATSRLTFSTIITSGYGAAFVYGDYLSQDPEIVRWTYYQPDYKGFYVYVQTNKATRLRVPTWTSKDGQDDIIWYEATAETNNIRGQSYNWKVYVPKSSHKNEIGYYVTHFYAYTAAGKSKSAGSGYQPPSVTEYTVRQKGSEGFYVYANAESTNRITIPVWTEANGQDDILNYTATAESNEIDGKTYAWCAFVPFLQHNNELGLYNIHFYPGNQYSEVIYSAKTTFDPDETAQLKVEKCEAWLGNASEKDLCYGTSTGSTLADFTVGDDYPESGSDIWFSVYFPSEVRNNYVRQSVWVYDESYKVSRDVYTHENEWYDVDFFASTIDETMEYFMIYAKVDLLDNDGNIVQEGDVYSFYIPVSPSKQGYSITARSITGDIAAYDGKDGEYGNVYVGQRIYPEYTFTSNNTWGTYFNLRGSLYEWRDDLWRPAYTNAETENCDLYEQNIYMDCNTSFTGGSAISPYTVPDNSASTSNRICVRLIAHWASGEVTMRTATFYWFILYADVELSDIKLVDSDGYVVDHNNLIPGQEVTIRYYYKNNTDCTVYVNGFGDDESMIDGIFTIPANETISVEGATITVPESDFTIWGGVYLEGAGIYNTEYESNGDNNELFLDCKVVIPLRIAPIYQPIPYKESIRVVTSYWVYNDSSMYVTPSENVSVDFKVYLGDTDKVLYQTSKDKIVVPIYEKNLVYFMWKVPNGIYPQKVRIAVTLKMNGDVTDEVSLKYSVQKFPDYSAPDTVFEESAPDGFAVPSPPVPLNDYATWWEWEYLDDMDMYTKRSYGIGINAAIKEKLERVDPNVSSNPDTIKSGYAFTYSSSDKFVSVSGYTMAPSSTYTGLQYSAMLYPEHGYKHSAGFCDVLTKLNNKWQFKNNAKYGRKHFIPIYFPDTKYVTAIVRGDCWTPAGVLGTTVLSEPLSVKGNAYEDWHLQHR